MKQVFDTNEIAHLWMHKTQDAARNKQGNCYFSDGTIYSYGSHFPIAKHVENKRGEQAVLFTTRSYSMTTAQHLQTVRHAIPSMVPVFDVSNPKLPLGEQIDAFSESIASAERDCFGKTGRFCPAKWDAMIKLIRRANSYAEFFGYRKRWTAPETADAVKAEIEKERRRQEATKRKQERECERRAKERIAHAEELLAKWKAGEDVNPIGFGFMHEMPVALRVVGDNVETTKGARFPVSHAVQGLKFVRSIVASGKPYKRNGHTFHLGHYAVDEVDAEGNVTAGCHYVTYAEIERIAPELEVAE